MKKFIKKLLFGPPEENIKIGHTALKNQRRNLIRVWNNEKHNDIGLEKLLRLFLIAIQFAFPGIYIRDKFGRKGLTWRNLAVEFYVLLKVLLPIVFLMTGLYHYKITVFITLYFLAETIFYVASLIFVADVFVKPRSYRRSILLLFLNYIEIVFDFAVIYGGLQLLDARATATFDYIYFSFITSATIGYGDFYPAGHLGKFVVSFQSILFLIFIVLFVNFFGSKVEAKNLHEQEDEF